MSRQPAPTPRSLLFVLAGVAAAVALLAALSLAGLVRVAVGSGEGGPGDGGNPAASGDGGSVAAGDGGGSPGAERVRRVVLVIGDGFGLGGLTAASLAIRGPTGGLAVEGAPVVGLVRTTAADGVATDSAAASTALATGTKTNHGVVGLSPAGERLTTLFDLAHLAGLATGTVTTSGAMDATPAGFTAHAESRRSYAPILAQMLGEDFDVLIGAHWGTLDSPEVRRALDEARQRGLTVIRREDELGTIEGPFAALFDPRPDSENAGGPPLATSATAALGVLSRGSRGFLLLLESEETDAAGHENDAGRLASAARELDAAVRVVLAFAEAHPGTLVLVTADHDTGGPGVVDGPLDAAPTVRWASDDHTATWVPLFAFGPGAERFAGVLDNTEIPRRIAALLELGALPSPGPP